MPDTVSVPPASAEKALPPGSLARDEVVAIVDQGLGRFLQRVAVEPSLEDGRFQGFRVLSLQPENFWRNVDLEPGDVVTSINGRSVESDVVVFEVFESLRTVDALDVVVMRGGQPHQLHYSIIGPPQPATNDSGTPSANGPR